MNTDRIEWVEFRGGRSGRANLTWGQQYIYQIIERLAPHDEHLNLAFSIPVPEHNDMESVRGVALDALASFETMRTRYPTDGAGAPRQFLKADVRLALRIREAYAAEEIGTRTDELLVELGAQRFDVGSDLLIRLGVVTLAGAPRQLLVVLSHMVTDGIGAYQLGRFLRSALAAPDGVTDRLAAPGWHPLDQIAFEESSAGRKVAARSLEWWREQLSGSPLLTTSTLPFTAADPRFWHGGITSPAVTEAARILATRERVSSNSVILAAVGCRLGAVAGERHPLLIVRVSNRLAEPARNSVGHLSQATPVRFDLGLESFSAFVRLVNGVALAAYRHGRYGPPQLDDLLARIERERGGQVDIGATFNCIRSAAPLREVSSAVSPERLRELKARTTFRWIEKRDTEAIKIFVYAQLDDELSVFADTRFLPPDEIRAFLYGVEEVLVRAAAGEDSLPHLMGRIQGDTRRRGTASGHQHPS